MPIGCQNRPAAERVKAAEAKVDAVDAAGDTPRLVGRSAIPQGSDGLRDLRLPWLTRPCQGGDAAGSN
jgi:hypothetical protein